MGVNERVEDSIAGYGYVDDASSVFELPETRVSFDVCLDDTFVLW